MTTLNPTQLSPLRALSNAMHSPGFSTHGRVLAVHLTHSYAHTHKSLNFLPESLKGGDWSLHETARALGLNCKAVSTYSHEDRQYRLHHHADNSFPPFSFHEDLDEDQQYDWGWKAKTPMRKTTWLNSASSHEEPQTAFMAYGNQASLDVQYSRAAMLIRVPHFRLRGKETPYPKSIYADVKLDERDYDDDDEYMSDRSSSDRSSNGTESDP